MSWSKEESCSKIKNGNGRLVQEDNKERRIWKVSLMIHIKQVLKSRLQSTCVALKMFRKAATLDYSRLEELR